MQNYLGVLRRMQHLQIALSELCFLGYCVFDGGVPVPPFHLLVCLVMALAVTVVTFYVHVCAISAISSFSWLPFVQSCRKSEFPPLFIRNWPVSCLCSYSSIMTFIRSLRVMSLPFMQALALIADRVGRYDSGSDPIMIAEIGRAHV